MARIRVQKRHRELISMLEADGFDAKVVDVDKHVRVRVARGDRSAIMVVAGSPSDWRARKEVLTVARRLVGDPRLTKGCQP